MRKLFLLVSLLGILLLSSNGLRAGTGVPVLVSPGDLAKIDIIEASCPTFNWAASGGAPQLELVVYRLQETDAGEIGERADAAIRVTLPGSAHGWTPSMDQRLEPGGAYAWSLRAVGARRPGRWAAPRFFRVTPLAGLAEIRHILELLRQEVKAVETSSVERQPLAALLLGEASAGIPARSALAPQVLLEAEAAIDVEPTASEGPAIGIRSIIQGDGAAGVFVSTGEAAILSGLSGDRLAFEVGARGDVLAQGEVTAASFSGSGADLTEVTAANLACYRCVDSNDIDDFGIEGVDVATSTIGGAHIIPGSLTGAHIAYGSLTGSDIQDGTISALDISDGNVLGRHLGDIYAVNVECNGGCGDSTLDEICFGQGFGELQPISVSCSEVASPGSSQGCYPAPGNDNDNDCSPVRKLTGDDPLSDFCADQGGWDAIVYCLEKEW